MINIGFNKSPSTWFPHSTLYFSQNSFAKRPCSQLKFNPWLCSSHTIVESLNDKLAPNRARIQRTTRVKADFAYMLSVWYR